MSLSLHQLILWVSGFATQLALFVVLFVRGRAKEYWVFALFNAFQLFKTIFLACLYRFGNAHQYALGYWSSTVIDYGLQIWLLIAIALAVLKPRGQWVAGSRKYFLFWGGVGALVSGVLGALAGSVQPSGWDRFDASASVFIALLICQLFIALSASANRLGLQRSSYVLALGVGLTVWAFSCLIETVSYLITGWLQVNVFTFIRLWVYCIATGYWCVVFWLPEKQKEPIPEGILLSLHDSLQRDLEQIEGGLK